VKRIKNKFLIFLFGALLECKSPTLPNMKGCFKISLLSHFEYCQIWLNILMDECHLRNITKLKKKSLLQTLAYMGEEKLENISVRQVNILP
jgi:hypothetical protein